MEYAYKLDSFKLETQRSTKNERFLQVKINDVYRWLWITVGGRDLAELFLLDLAILQNKSELLYGPVNMSDQ